jgi:drug/metabolite transporter (DMT)-like permease
MRRIHADLLLLLSAAIWGLAFVFQKTAMEHVGPNAFIAARALLAALALLPFALIEQRRAATPIQPGLWRVGLWGGILFYISALFQQVGLITATVSNSGFLTALYVIITPFIAWIYLGQRVTPIVWIAVAFSFVGTWALGGGTLAGFNGGDGLVAICAIFWAIHLAVTAASSRFDRPLTFTTIQFTIVGILGVIAAAATETTTIRGLLAAAPEIAFVGLLSSALTFTLLAIAMKHTSAAETAIIVSLETVFAAVAGAVLLGERLSGIAMVGAATILAAIILVQISGQTAAKDGQSAPAQ